MQSTKLAIPDVVLFTPNFFGDERGFFFESFSQLAFEEATGLKRHFVQDNHSKSQRGVLRGLHYQLDPMAQGKLVRVVQGEIFDVSVDIRKNSPTFGKWVGEILTAENRKQIWIPEGFAHGFLTLSATAEVVYKTTCIYAVEYERSILWNDPDLAINWQFQCEPLLSSKDQKAALFKDADVF